MGQKWHLEIFLSPLFLFSLSLSLSLSHSQYRRVVSQKKGWNKLRVNWETLPTSLRAMSRDKKVDCCRHTQSRAAWELFPFKSSLSFKRFLGETESLFTYSLYTRYPFCLFLPALSLIFLCDTHSSSFFKWHENVVGFSCPRRTFLNNTESYIIELRSFNDESVAKVAAAISKDETWAILFRSIQMYAEMKLFSTYARFKGQRVPLLIKNSNRKSNTD